LSTLLMPVQPRKKNESNTMAVNFIKRGKINQFRQIFWK
jgi:hypothetical protein